MTSSSYSRMTRVFTTECCNQTVVTSQTKLMSSFIQQTEASYAAHTRQSGQFVGMLKQMLSHIQSDMWFRRRAKTRRVLGWRQLASDSQMRRKTQVFRLLRTRSFSASHRRSCLSEMKARSWSSSIKVTVVAQDARVKKWWSFEAKITAAIDLRRKQLEDEKTLLDWNIQKARMSCTTSRRSTMKWIAWTGNLVQYNDLIETVELENLIGQTAQCLHNGKERHEFQGIHDHELPEVWRGAEAKKALASTETLNSKTASAIDAESSELVISIDVLTRTTAVLGCGRKQFPAEQSQFRQQQGGNGLQQYLVNRPTLLSFLWGGDSQGYTLPEWRVHWPLPRSGEGSDTSGRAEQVQAEAESTDPGGDTDPGGGHSELKRRVFPMQRRKCIEDCGRT